MNSIKLNDQVGRLPDIRTPTEPSRRWGALKKEIFKRKLQKVEKDKLASTTDGAGSGNNKFSGETKMTTIQSENGDVVNISEFSLAPMQLKHQHHHRPAGAHSGRLVYKTLKSVSMAGDSTSNVPASRRQQQSEQESSGTGGGRRASIVLPNLRLPPPEDGGGRHLRMGARSLPRGAGSVYNESRVGATADAGSLVGNRFEPTYRTDPLVKFDRIQAEHIINEELNALLLAGRLDSTQLTMPSAVKTLIESVTTRIKSRIKEISDKRYKILVNCTLSEQKYQGIIIASKCLWDQRNDTCVTVKQTFKNHVILVNVFAIYHE